MATNTPNYNLKKPDEADFYDVQDFNENADKIDEALVGKIDKASPATNNNLAALDAEGNVKDSGKKPSDFGSSTDLAKKIDKVTGATLNNLAVLNADGSIRDSGKSFNDLPTEQEFNAHILTDVDTEGGVHGIRYFDDKLQFYNGSEWVTIETGGSGFPPANCTDISMTQGNSRLTIKWTDPNDTVVDGVTIVAWAGTKLVRKIGSFPTSEVDGTLVVNSTTRNAYRSTGFTDTGLTNGVTYYYKLFPYSDKGQVTNSPDNQITGVPQAYKTFGVSINLGNSNPESAVTYTDDAISMTPGSSAWDSQNIFKDIKPCVLKNGVVQYYLNPLNFAQKADGTSADITSGTAGDVMIEIPKTGFQISTVGTTLTIKVTDDPNKSGFKYYAHTRSTEGDRQKLYIGAYLGYTSGSALRSLSGKSPTPNKTIGAFRTEAKANGSAYDLVSFYPLTLLQCLFLVRFKNLNSQAALGRGYVDGNSASIATGNTNAKGMNYGETTGKQQMKFLGIEDFWGNMYWWIDGLWSDANRNMCTAFQNFNDTGANYTSRGQGATANIGNYMSKPQGTNETGFIAKEVSGSATTYFSDGANLDASRLPIFGGAWNNGDAAGVFRLIVYSTASYASSYVGARLMYL